MNARRGRYVALILVLLTSAYGLYQARTLISGPTLVVTAPLDRSFITASHYTVQGQVTHASRLRVNGVPLATNREGLFETTLVTPEGQGVILVEASNRFGHTSTVTLDIVGNPSHPPAVVPHATTSSTTRIY